MSRAKAEVLARALKTELGQILSQPGSKPGAATHLWAAEPVARVIKAHARVRGETLEALQRKLDQRLVARSGAQMSVEELAEWVDEVLRHSGP
jgi:hypothetical protein